MAARLRTAVLAGCLAMLSLAVPAHAAFPGQNGRIAINSFAPGIETINADGTDANHLTDDGGAAEWSADGTKIAFNRCSPTCHIWVMSSDGTGQAQVTNGVGEHKPSWSPDGSRLVFVRPGLDQIWTVKADGTGEALVASGLKDIYSAPQWSPDGTKIVFESDHRQAWPNQEIYTVHPDGTGMTRLTTASNQLFPCEAYPQRTFGPDWSPDGTKIAYDYYHDTADGECTGPTALHVMNADGTGDHVVVGYYDTPDYIEGPPSWAPDGTRITFDASAVTYVVNANGGPATVVTGDGPPTDWQPLPVNTPSVFARPKGASPIYVSLVPAYAACSAPNRSHGAPLAFGSCAPPVLASPNLAVGTPDVNGQRAKSVGYAVLNAKTGNPHTPADEADVRLQVNFTDVRLAGSLGDYTGELEARTTVRLTDRSSGVASTTQDHELKFPAVCSATADTAVGSVCSVQTTVDTLVPNTVTEGSRAVWELGKIEVYDGGSDGVASTSPNSVFASQGIFVP